MKQTSQGLLEYDNNELEVLGRLLHLHHKILRHHDVDGLAQLILHELGHQESLGLTKAGYLMENPDFGCLRGIAGYCGDECSLHKNDMWENPYAFADDMKKAPFHQQLSSFVYQNLPRRKNGEIDEEAVQSLGRVLGMKNPSLFTWPMRHGNYGLLIVEDTAKLPARRKTLLHDCAALLSLC